MVGEDAAGANCEAVHRRGLGSIGWEGTRVNFGENWLFATPSILVLVVATCRICLDDLPFPAYYGISPFFWTYITCEMTLLPLFFPHLTSLLPQVRPTLNHIRRPSRLHHLLHLTTITIVAAISTHHLSGNHKSRKKEATTSKTIGDQIELMTRGLAQNQGGVNDRSIQIWRGSSVPAEAVAAVSTLVFK